jgi:hypothetical protein
VSRDGVWVAWRWPVEMGPVQREVEGREGWRVGVEMGWWYYNISFVMEEIKVEKWVTMEGEERRIEGSLPWWPLSKTGLLADMSRYGPWILKKNGQIDP